MRSRGHWPDREAARIYTNLAMSRIAMLMGLWGLAVGWEPGRGVGMQAETPEKPQVQQFDSKGAVDVSFGKGVGIEG
jgi:hypothetical protein